MLFSVGSVFFERDLFHKLFLKFSYFPVICQTFTKPRKLVICYGEPFLEAGTGRVSFTAACWTPAPLDFNGCQTPEGKS